MNKEPQSLDAARADVLVDIEKSLMAFLESEERRVKRMLLRNLDHKESADTRRYAREVLFDIRLKTSLLISREITSLRARQVQSLHGAPREGTRPVGRRSSLSV